MSINYYDKIPNNVNLANDRKLQRALEHWQPHFLKWWSDQGPKGFQSNDVYLRTAVGVDAKGAVSAGVASGVSAEACDLGPASRPMCQSDESESRCETSTMNVTVVETSTTRRTSPAISLVEPR